MKTHFVTKKNFHTSYLFLVSFLLTLFQSVYSTVFIEGSAQCDMGTVFISIPGNKNVYFKCDENLKGKTITIKDENGVIVKKINGIKVENYDPLAGAPKSVLTQIERAKTPAAKFGAWDFVEVSEWGALYDRISYSLLMNSSLSNALANLDNDPMGQRGPTYTYSPTLTPQNPLFCFYYQITGGELTKRTVYFLIKYIPGKPAIQILRRTFKPTNRGASLWEDMATVPLQKPLDGPSKIQITPQNDGKLVLVLPQNNQITIPASTKNVGGQVVTTQPVAQPTPATPPSTAATQPTPQPVTPTSPVKEELPAPSWNVVTVPGWEAFYKTYKYELATNASRGNFTVLDYPNKTQFTLPLSFDPQTQLMCFVYLVQSGELARSKMYVLIKNISAPDKPALQIFRTTLVPNKATQWEDIIILPLKNAFNGVSTVQLSIKPSGDFSLAMPDTYVVMVPAGRKNSKK